MPEIITRFAPSPTGHLHIGGARTALFNWLLARSLNGKFVLRIEDTDLERSSEEHTKAILEAMQWLNLNWDGDPIYQRPRADIHRKYIFSLVENGQAYWCHCSPEEVAAQREEAIKNGLKPKYSGKCKDKNLEKTEGAVVRFKTPLGETSWDDLVKGQIIFQNSELDDLILLKSDNMPTYNVAVVVDDIEMKISHIIRGDDHVNNTPRQILLYQAFKAQLPLFGHVPMILGSDKARLSKRHGATSVLAYQEMGILPEALNNYLVRLGWSHGDEEIFSLEDLIKLFNIKNVGRSASVFNEEKLHWLNSHYIKQATGERLKNLTWPFLEAKNYKKPNDDFLIKCVLSVQERAKTIVEMAQQVEFYLADLPTINPKAKEKVLTNENKIILKDFLNVLKKWPTEDDFSEDIKQFAQEKNIKLGAIAQSLRVAITGDLASPNLYTVLNILPLEDIKKRIEVFIR